MSAEDGVRGMGRSWPALLSWAIAAAGLVTGLGVAVCQIPPDNLVGHEAYGHVFSAHGAVALAALPLLLVPMTKSEWLTTPRVRGVALGLVVAGTSLVGFAGSVGRVLGVRAPYLAAPLGALVLCIAALVFAFAVGRHGHEPRAARLFRVAALIGLALWLGIRTALPMLLREMPTQVFVFDPQTVLILLERAGPPLGICMALGATGPLALRNAQKVAALTASAALCAFGVLAAASVHGSALVVALPAGVIFGARAFPTAARAPSRWERWIRRAQSVVFIEALLTHAWLSLIDVSIRLHDTLFVVGASHLAFFAAALGWLHASNPADERSAAVGLGAILTGGHVLVLAHLVLGSQGCPRRYAAYLAEQEGWFLLHGLAALAGAVLLVGCGVVALSVKDRERPREF